MTRDVWSSVSNVARTSIPPVVPCHLCVMFVKSCPVKSSHRTATCMIPSAADSWTRYGPPLTDYTSMQPKISRVDARIFSSLPSNADRCGRVRLSAAALPLSFAIEREPMRGCIYHFTVRRSPFPGTATPDASMPVVLHLHHTSQCRDVTWLRELCEA